MRCIINVLIFFLCVFSASLFSVSSVAEVGAQSSSVSASAVSSGTSTITADKHDCATKSCDWISPSPWMIYIVSMLVPLAGVLAILTIKNSLPGNWSLSDALSEEVPLKVAKKTTTTKDATGQDLIIVEELVDKDGKPILLPELRASSSRVIALMGMIVILLMYMGFGTFALYSFGGTGELSREKMDGVVKFLVAGMTLFAPYVVNKFSDLFKGLTGAR